MCTKGSVLFNNHVLSGHMHSVHACNNHLHLHEFNHNDLCIQIGCNTLVGFVSLKMYVIRTCILCTHLIAVQLN